MDQRLLEPVLSTIHQSIDAWRDTLKNLASAAPIFRKSTQELAGTLNLVLPLSTSTAQDEIYGGIDDTLQHLSLVELDLLMAKRQLAQMRNRSPKLSPISRLPPELLSRIFVLACHQQILEREVTAVKKDETPLAEPMVVTAVGLVCEQWRSVAINTAALWTRIDFRQSPPFKWANLLIAERSKSAPLKILLGLRETQSRAVTDSAVHMLVVDPPTAARVETIRIHTKDLLYLQQLFTRLVGFTIGLPSIVDLSLVHEERREHIDNDDDNSNLITDTTEYFHSKVMKVVNRVQRLQLGGCYLSWSRLPFGGLTSLRINRIPGSVLEAWPTEEQFVQLLVRCPQLRTLELSDFGVQMDNLDDVDKSLARWPETIVLNSLTTLRMERVPWDVIYFLLDRISAPFVRDLTLGPPDERSNLAMMNSEDGEMMEDGSEDIDDLLHFALITFLRRISSTPSVVSLTLDRLYDAGLEAHFFTHCLAEVLELVPSLRRLTLRDMVFDDELLRLFNGASATDPERPTHMTRAALCPSLKFLGLSGDMEISAGALRQMLEIRKREGNPINTLRLADVSSPLIDLTEYEEMLKSQLTPFVSDVRIFQRGVELYLDDLEANGGYDDYMDYA